MQTDERVLKRIQELSDAKGPSGFEEETIAVARRNLEDLCDLEEDRSRNLYIRRRHNTGKLPVVMLDAHSDEVGLMIHSIKPCGTLRFVELGRWSKNTLAGTKVLVRNAGGEWIRGVIAAKPPHFLSEKERQANQIPEVCDLVIDIGATSKEDAVRNFGIRIGEPAVPAASFAYDQKRDVMSGKGFDCRIGCAVLIETMRRVSEMDLKVDVVGVLSSQEEVGERGCSVSVHKVKPVTAICFEGCPADDTFTEPYAVQTAMRKGPMLRFMDTSVICNPRFQRFALETAEKNDLPVQASVREGGGNDAAVIQLLEGAPSIVMGVPVRYIHSANCLTTYEDYQSSVDLSVALLRTLDDETIHSF